MGPVGPPPSVPAASPQQARHVPPDADSVVSALTDHFVRTLMHRTARDAFDDLGRPLFEAKVRHWVERGDPVQMVLPAFPFKSRNHVSKTIGDLPDKGEELALRNLHNYCESASRLYSPGVQLIIVSDGRVYADLLQVPDTAVERYDRRVREMMTASPYVRWDNLDSIAQDLSDDMMRRKLLCKYGVTLEDVDCKIRSDENVAATYCGFQIFVWDDLFACTGGGARSKQQRRECKRIAREMMVRNEAYTGYIAERYPHVVRLSIHAYRNDGPKFSINMLGDTVGCDPSEHIPTPWHHVTVEFPDGSFRLMRLCKVGQLDGCADLVHYPDGSPSHYKFTPALREPR